MSKKLQPNGLQYAFRVIIYMYVHIALRALFNWFTILQK